MILVGKKRLLIKAELLTTLPLGVFHGTLCYKAVTLLRPFVTDYNNILPLFNFEDVNKTVKRKYLHSASGRDFLFQYSSLLAWFSLDDM